MKTCPECGGEGWVEGRCDLCGGTGIAGWKMVWKWLLKWFQGVELFYLPEALDHRLPELAVVREGRIQPMAVEEQTQTWRENPEEIGLGEDPYLSDPEY